MKPLAPTIVNFSGSDSKKTMLWPLQFVMPNQSENDLQPEAIRQQIISKNDGIEGTFNIVVIPEKVIAVGRFTDIIVEPIVRKVHAMLKDTCIQDGLQPTPDAINDTMITFAQYDAVYSMGKRRNEVHVELANGGHPY